MVDVHKSAERLNRETWKLLDTPTIGYIIELVRVAAGDAAWEKTRAALAKLAETGGHCPELWETRLELPDAELARLRSAWCDGYNAGLERGLGHDDNSGSFEEWLGRQR